MCRCYCLSRYHSLPSTFSFKDVYIIINFYYVSFYFCRYRNRWTKNAPEVIAAGAVPCSEHRYA